MGKGRENQTELASNSLPLLTGCATSGKSPGLSEPQFPVLSKDHSNSVHLIRSLSGLNKVVPFSPLR